MKALTICQPHAERIARGEKPIENRTWPTSYRGWLLIHAGKSREWMDADDEIAYPGMAFGAIVAAARLVDCLHIDRPESWPTRFLEMALHQHEHANGPWCWVLEDVCRLREPVPCRGAQGLWSADAATVDAARRMCLPAASARTEP